MQGAKSQEVSEKNPIPDYFLMGEHSITGIILLFSICMHMNTHRQHSNMIKIIAECCLGFRLFFSCGLNNCFPSYQFL